MAPALGVGTFWSPTAGCCQVRRLSSPCWLPVQRSAAAGAVTGIAPVSVLASGGVLATVALLVVGRSVLAGRSVAGKCSGSIGVRRVVVADAAVVDSGGPAILRSVQSVASAATAVAAQACGRKVAVRRPQRLCRSLLASGRHSRSCVPAC